jgi:GNAT superfamily N-acetyltransferase
LIEIRMVKHAEEIDQLLELFALSFGQKTTAESWGWRYIQNPLARFMPDVTVAVDNGKIVGARPFLLNEMWFGDKKVIAAQHCDTMVHPDYRRQGIFNRMGKFAISYLSEHDCALSFGFPGPMSRNGFFSQGYRRLVPTEILLRLIKPGQVIACNVKNKPMGKSLGFLCDRLFVSRKIEYSSQAQAYQVEVSDHYTSELNTLDILRNNTVIDMVRTETNLHWRFDTHPRNTYQYIIAKKEGKVHGYAIIGVQEQLRGLIAGFIIDYLVKDGDVACFHALLVKALGELEKTACHVVVTWAFSEPHLRHELLEHFGFKSSLGFPYHKVMDSGYMDVLLVDERMANTIDIYHKANWRVTYAYPNYT